MKHLMWLLVAGGAFILGVTVSQGFGVSASWYWWVLFGVGIGVVKAA